MSKAYRTEGVLPGDEPTTQLSPLAGGKSTSPTSARLALVGESDQQITRDVRGLRRRLRIAALILLAAFGIFLVRGLLNLEQYKDRPLDLALHALVVAVMVAVTTALWSGWPLSLRWLRTLELLLFGSAAGFFLWL